MIDGLWRGEIKCNGEGWRLKSTELQQECMSLEVEHVKAHRSEKELEMTLFQ